MNTALLALTLAGTLDGPHAHHDVAIADDRLVVDSRWGPGAWEYSEVELAVPLPADAELDGATALRDRDGRIVAIAFARGDSAHTRTTVPLMAAIDRRELPLPVLAGGGVQRVTLDPALGFRPDPGLEMVTHLGHHVATELDHPQRRAIDRQLRAAPIGSYYATTDVIAREHGFTGELELRADVRRRTAIGVAAIFVLVCGAGVIAYRRSRRGAEAERAEQVLAAEFDGLERDST